MLASTAGTQRTFRVIWDDGEWKATCEQNDAYYAFGRTPLLALKRVLAAFKDYDYEQ